MYRDTDGMEAVALTFAEAEVMPPIPEVSERDAYLSIRTRVAILGSDEALSAVQEWTKAASTFWRRTWPLRERAAAGELTEREKQDLRDWADAARTLADETAQEMRADLRGR